MLHSLIVLACTITLISSNQQFTFQESKPVQKELPKVGKTIQSLVQLAKQTGMRPEEINLVLQNIIQNHINQNSLAEQTFENDNRTCYKFINDTQSSIFRHNNQITILTQLNEDSSISLFKAQEAVSKVIEDLEQNQITYNSESMLRSEQKEIFHFKISEHDTNIALVDETTLIIQNLKAGVSLKEIKTRFDKIYIQLAQSKTTLFKPLISSLAQLAVKLEDHQISMTLDLLNQIRQQVMASRNILIETEERQVENWDVQDVRLYQEKKNLNDRKAFHNGNVGQYQGKIRSTMLSLEDLALGQEEEILASTSENDYWEFKSTSYFEQKQERDSHILSIKELQHQIINVEDII